VEWFDALRLLLWQVIESTGVVVTPYMEYPQLLGMLLQMLSEGSPQARTEVLKVRDIDVIALACCTTLFKHMLFKREQAVCECIVTDL